MIEVHHLNNSRSQRVLWMLEELAVDYNVTRHERDPVTMLAPASLKAVHPLGKSPVIRDGDQVIAESAVILEYLTERYGGGKFAPKPGSAAYLPYRYWMHYAEGTIMQQLLVRLYLTRVGDAAAALLQRVVGAIEMHLDYIESNLGTKRFLTGEELTTADVMMSFPLELVATQGFLKDKRPGLRDLVARYHERPTYQRALTRGGPYAYAH
ncbi:MAG: glutathione S-transferase family protein [Steroidobacteraceae bacterium]